MTSEVATTRDNTTDSGRLLTVDEVAERMSVLPSYVRMLVFKKRIPYTKLGKYVRIAEADVDAFLEARRVECED